MRDLEEAVSPLVVAAMLLFFLALASGGWRCQVSVDSRQSDAGDRAMKGEA